VCFDGWMPAQFEFADILDAAACNARNETSAPVNGPPDLRPPQAIAFEWVGKITGIALEIVLIIWLGQWLGKKLNLQWITYIALAAGPALGFWHLLQLTGIASGSSPTVDRDEEQNQ
jgi:hypothetical protein